ncbi:MAG: YbgA family protein [Spirochaetaceae bacterium]|nr:YbgA family protein [Spirochaetaceae bacterium]
MDIDGKQPAQRGQGLFAQRLSQDFPGVAMEEEGRLHNFALRGHFLIHVYTSARFHQIKSLKDLVNFHSRHKLLFLGYNQAAMRRMGKVVANHEGQAFQEMLKLYRIEMDLLFSSPFKHNSMINVLDHAFGGFKQLLKSDEKAFFKELLEDYRDERIPLSVALNMLKGWSIQHGNEYLLSQQLMEPYPKTLIEISDSGKGRQL